MTAKKTGFRTIILLAALFALLFFQPAAYAPNTGQDNYDPQDTYSQDTYPQDTYQQENQPLPDYGNYPVAKESMQGGGNFGATDFGMIDSSIADPEYVGQEKMVENLTTVYNWISENSTRFMQGCRGDRKALEGEIISVINKTQKTSEICDRFSREAKDCNPEAFCARFTQGKIPLPPEALAAAKKAGYDTGKITASTISEEMILKICMAQTNLESEKQNQKIESVKNALKEQLPRFRQKCDELMKWKEKGMGMEVRLPEFNFPMNQPQIEQREGQNKYNQTQGKDYYPNNPQQYPEPRMGCKEEEKPLCKEGTWPNCMNGGWSCIGNTMPPGQPYPKNEIVVVVPETTTISTTEIPIEQARETIPEPQPSGETQASTSNPIAETITGFVTIVAKTINLQNDYTGSEGQQPYYPNQPATSYGEQPYPQNPEGSAGYGGGYTGTNPQPYVERTYAQGTMPQQPAITKPQGKMPYAEKIDGYPANGMPQGGNPGPGMGSPEMMCELSDEEIIENYTSQMGTGMPPKEEMEYRCRMEATKILGEMNRYKLGIAKCKADAALDCAAKQEALKNCSEMQANPEKIAGQAVNSMCRRFGISMNEKVDKELYRIANKWYDSDPAFANQLGDTADQTAEDKSKLGILNYLFGDTQYAEKIKERAGKLREAKSRLAEKGNGDAETLSVLEEQSSELEREAQKFNNLLDITRLTDYLTGANR